MKTASVGTISHGTLRSEDLLAAFADELEHHVTRNAELPLDERERLTKLIWDARELEDFPNDAADELVNELRDELNVFAPPYCYFGTLDGDGSDFGFWPCRDEIEELPCVADPADVENHLGEPCRFVNDHGNVTVYNADGTIALELV